MARRKHRSHVKKIGKPVSLGGGSFNCYSKRVKNGRGGGRSLRGYCRRNK